MTETPKPPRFVMIDRGLWYRVSCTNDLAKMTAFLVQATGTGIDCCTTKWSTRAIETYAGQRKELSKTKIAEMVSDGILVRLGTETKPLYRFTAFEREGAIILPHQLVMGFSGEVPILRRVRERRDPLLLRMLIELYANVDGDQPGYVSPTFLRSYHHDLWTGKPEDPIEPRMDGEVARWRFYLPPEGEGRWHGNGWPKWMSGEWDRMQTLEDLGVIQPQDWLLNGALPDADYLTPLSTRLENGPCEPIEDEIECALEALADHLRGDGVPHEGRWDGAIPIPLRIAQPNVVTFYKLRVEPDTWGMRGAYARRLEMIADFAAEMQAARQWVTQGSAKIVRLKPAAAK